MNNPLSQRPEHALYPYPAGCTGYRLWQMLKSRLPEVGRAAYCAAFDRRNLVVGEWRVPAARSAGAWAREAFRTRTVLVLGAQTWSALGLPNVPVVLPYTERRSDVSVPASWHTTWRLVPHPSGRNLWYNDPANRLVVSLLLEDAYLSSCLWQPIYTTEGARE